MAYGLYDLILQVIAYAIVIAGIIALLNFLTSGYVLKYIRVRASRGTRLMVRVHGITGIRYRIGQIKDKTLQFKDEGKLKKYEKVNKYNIFKEAAVQTVEVDEVSNSVRTVNWQSTPGHDTDHFDNLLVRALERPNLADKTKETIMFLLIIALVLMMGFALYLLYNISQQLGTIKALGNVI